MPESWRLFTGDCLDALATREPETVDACVTDPPYSLSFMGRSWDTFRSSHEFEAWTQQWAEAVLRVLKPGAHAVVCASPRRPAASSFVQGRRPRLRFRRSRVSRA